MSKPATSAELTSLEYELHADRVDPDDALHLGRLGCCPGCGLPAPVAEPCRERGCRQRGLHGVPAELVGDLDPRTRDPRLGQIVGGHLLVALCGAGGFGRVYRALVLAADGAPTGDEVAVKLAIGLPGATLAAQRLVREARALAGLDHPNIVRLLGSGMDGDAPYLVMEYLAESRSLADEIAERAAAGRSFAASEIVGILGSVLEGLGAAHAAGVLHRDAKPDNVMLVAEPGGLTRVKLVDFGLARSGEGERARSQALGTPTHMAPEQLGGSDALGPWTDLWAVGVIAFELMTGTLPFDGATTSEVLRARRGRHVDPVARAPALPPACAAFLARALAPSPSDRFQDAPSMLAALARALDAWHGPTTPPRPHPPVPPSQRQTLHELVPPEPAPPELATSPFLEALRPLFPAGLMTLLTALVLMLGTRPARPTPLVPTADLAALQAIAPLHAALAEARRAPPAPTPPAAEAARDADTQARAALATLTDAARRCEASPASLRELASACSPELGCRLVPLPPRGLPTIAPNPGETLAIVFQPADFGAPDTCGARYQRRRAIVQGAWDEVEPAWASYVQPRVLLEARTGRDVLGRVVLAERSDDRQGFASARAPLADPGSSACFKAESLAGSGARTLTLETLEELRFQVADTGRFTREVGRVPCRLGALAVMQLGARPSR